MTGCDWAVDQIVASSASAAAERAVVRLSLRLGPSQPHTHSKSGPRDQTHSQSHSRAQSQSLSQSQTQSLFQSHAKTGGIEVDLDPDQLRLLLHGQSQAAA